MLLWLIVVSTLLFISFCFVLRGYGINALRTELDMESTPIYNDMIKDCLRASKLHRANAEIEIENLMTSELDGTRIAVFDMRQIVDSTVDRYYSNWQSVTVLLPPRHNLPVCQLYPEGIVAKIASALGAQDIDFADHFEFSHLYVLKGENERLVRKFFNRPVLDLMAKNPGWWIDINRRGIIIRPANKRMDRSQIERSMDLAVKLGGLLGRQGSLLLRSELAEVKGLGSAAWLPQWSELAAAQDSLASSHGDAHFAGR